MRLKAGEEDVYVDGGRTKLLTAEASYLAGLKWGLFTNNISIVETNVFADLTEAAWAGYNRITVGVLTAAAIAAGRAVSQPQNPPSFGNSSGGTVTFFGWFLIDPADSTLVAAVNVGQQNLANGGSYPLAAVFSNTDG